MSIAFEFVAESRGQSGTSAARVVRRQGRVPAVVYGGHADPVSVSLSHNEVLKHLANDAVYAHVLDLTIDGKVEKVVLKGLQRHPAKPQILHMDFMRVNMQEEIRVHVPIHFKGATVCVGVKAGGLLMPLMSDVEVVCLPSALPEFIEIDVTALAVGVLNFFVQLVFYPFYEILEFSNECQLKVLSDKIDEINREDLHVVDLGDEWKKSGLIEIDKLPESLPPYQVNFKIKIFNY